jgi:hypothetical protein
MLDIMIRRIAVIVAALVVLGVGGMAVYATTLPTEDVLNDTAGRICRTIVVNRPDLPAPVQVMGVFGFRMDMSKNEALALYDDIKKTAPDIYGARIEHVKQVYSDNRSFYRVAARISYSFSKDTQPERADNIQCWFLVSTGLSGEHQSEIDAVYLNGRMIKKDDSADWKRLTESSELSADGRVQPTLQSRIKFLLMPIYDQWRVDKQ